MKDIYTADDYREKNPSWHEEDSPWKAEQILKMLNRHSLPIATIAEIGCGVGEILIQLKEAMGSEVRFHGYDIAPHAIARAKLKEAGNIEFHAQDMLALPVHFDLLLVIDVIEHIKDCYGFLEACRDKATYKLFHIPLDLHVSSVLRGIFVHGRKTVGHIHYFSEESAIESLKDSGYEIVDILFTEGGVGLAKLHPTFKRHVANIPRRIVGRFSPHWSARLFGGYSLLVLCK